MQAEVAHSWRVGGNAKQDATRCGVIDARGSLHSPALPQKDTVVVVVQISGLHYVHIRSTPRPENKAFV